MFLRNVRTQLPIALLLGTLGACQRAAVSPATASATPSARPGASTLTKAGGAGDRAPASAAVPAPSPPPADPSPFVEGVRLGYPARLNVAGQRVFLTTEKLVLALHDEGVRIEPALLDGLQQGRSQFPRVFGNMPESGWALQTSYAERTSHSTLSRWTGSEWVNADGLLQNQNVLGAAPWSGGRTLALLASEYEKKLYFQALGGGRGGPLPQLPRAGRDDYGCVHGIQPAGMTALASGEVFLAGTRCSVNAAEEVSAQGVIVHRWAAGQARSTVSVLPGLAEKDAASGEITSLVAASGNDLFAAGVRVPNAFEGQDAREEAYLAHFDGSAWRVFSTPAVDRIDDLQRTPKGSLWALSEGELWTTVGPATEHARWQHVALPQLASEAGEHAVSSFWVQDNEQVWATLGSDGFSYLVRTKRGSAPLSVPSDSQIAQLSTAFDPMAAYQCESPTLVLLTLSRQAPKDADAPSVRAALRGHAEFDGKLRLIEVPFLTRRYLGVQGDLESLIAAQDILGNANLPGVAPELRCLNAEPTRSLALEFGPAKPQLLGVATRRRRL